MTTHQSPNLESVKLARYGNVNAKQIIKKIKAPVVLCYSGMSGTGTATAIMLALVANNFRYPIGMFYVRKDFDVKYDYKRSIEFHNIHHPKTVFIFVDDHIGGGRTFDRCRKALQKDLPDTIYKQTWAKQLRDDDSKLIKWPAQKDFKPEITYACLRCFGLHKVSDAATWGIGSRKPLFQKEVEKQDWFKELGGIA